MAFALSGSSTNTTATTSTTVEEQGAADGGDSSALAAPRCRPDNATLACTAGTSVCAGYRDIKGYAGTGVCLNVTVRYIPSYSTALDCIGCNGTATYYDYRWTVTDAAQAW